MISRTEIIAYRLTRAVILCGALLVISVFQCTAQQTPAQPTSASDSPASSPTTPSSLTTLTLDEAITRARANEPTFAAAFAASRVAALDRSIARSALLPGVVYHNQYLYTQSNRVNGLPLFIANNAVHEYTSQAVVTETIGLQQVTAVYRAAASAAVASAELEISRRGLVSTVVSLFYTSLAADHKLAVAQRANDEAVRFTTLTQQRETAREVAHADVVKAQLQQQQRERDLADATLLRERARLELGVLLFPDPRSPYILSIPSVPPALATRSEIEAAAAKLNPELTSAMATLRGRNLDVTAAKAAYLPDLVLNYNYGIDADRFATRGPEGIHNLGYSASATVDIPIWNWFSTQHKIRQTQILRDAARVTLSATQRRLIAKLDEFYAEAVTARDQLRSLQLSVQTAQESLQLVRLRYSSGEATVLEVVDAQNSLTIAELAREDGTTRYQAALANLQMLTGTI